MRDPRLPGRQPRRPRCPPSPADGNLRVASAPALPGMLVTAGDFQRNTTPRSSPVVPGPPRDLPEERIEPGPGHGAHRVADDIGNGCVPPGQKDLSDLHEDRRKTDERDGRAGGRPRGRRPGPPPAVNEKPERHEHRDIHRDVESPFTPGGVSETQVPAGELPEEHLVVDDPERRDEKNTEGEEIDKPDRRDNTAPADGRHRGCDSLRQQPRLVRRDLLPGLVRVEELHLSGQRRGLRAEILLVDDAVVVHDERHHA